MSAIDDKPFPKPALIGAAGLIACALVLTVGTRLNLPGFPEPARPELVPAGAEAVSSRSLAFETLPSGAIQVFDRADGTLLSELDANSGGFISGALRGLRRAHMQRGLSSRVEAELTLWSDGRLTLVDPVGGPSAPAVIDLHAFGASNRQAFADLLPTASPTVAHSAQTEGRPS